VTEHPQRNSIKLICHLQDNHFPISKGLHSNVLVVTDARQP
jgi:hypothetical protein